MESNLFFKLTFELIIGCIALIISVRIIGRRQLQQITPFDFVFAIVLGEILGNLLYDPNTPWYYMIYAVLVWTILSYLIEIINVKSFKIRTIIEGVPALIIKEGQIQYDVMKKEKIDFNELMALLRQKDIFSLQEVQYAFIETNGALSVLKKSSYQTPNRSDLQIQKPEESLSLMVILDGEIMKNNLTLLQLSENWLMQKLKEHQIPSIKAVLYAEWHQGQFYYQLFSSNNKKN